jgi:hypothetical protein
MSSEAGEAATLGQVDLTPGRRLIQINFCDLWQVGKNATVCIFVSRVVLRQVFVAYSLESGTLAVVYSRQHHTS